VYDDIASVLDIKIMGPTVMCACNGVYDKTVV